MTGASHDLGALLRREVGRRGFLRSSLGGIALLGAGAVLPSGCRRYPEPPAPLEFFTQQEYAVFSGATRALLGLPDPGFDAALRVDHLVARMDRWVRRDIRWALRIFEHGTRVFDLKGKRFTGLTSAEQEAYLRGWMTSSMGARRVVFRALKLLAALGTYGRREAWDLVGYDGPWLARREVPIGAAPEAAVPLERFAGSGE